MPSIGDYQRIVDGIRLYMQAGDRSLTPEVQRLAGEFAKACNELNDRLRKCQEFLRQNLRSEAVHLAEADPRLLNAYELLDFPDRLEWEQLLVDYGLGSMPGLLTEVAQELNDAYSSEEPLKVLLRKHRRLALRRAPLSERLAVLREIATADPNTLYWEDDLRGYEQMRCEELAGDLKRLQEAGDAAALTTLLAEVDSPLWRTPPAEQLVKAVRQAAHKQARGHARGEVQRLSNELLKAHDTRDILTARRLREAWKKQQAVAGLAASDSSVAGVQPVWAWIDEEDRRAAAHKEWQKAVGRLEAALNVPGEADPAELEQLAAAVKQYEFGLPAELESRLKSRVTGVVRAGKRRQFAVAAVVAAIVLIGVSVVAAIVVAQMSSGQIRTAREFLEKRLIDSDVTAARKYLDELKKTSPSTAASTAIRELEARLEKLEQSDTDRKDAFQNALEQARKDIDAGLQPRSLETAKRLARGEKESSQVERLETDWSRASQVNEKEVNQRFLDGMQALSPQISQIESQLLSGSVDDADSGLTKLETQAAQLRKARGTLKSAVPPEAAAIEQKLKDLRAKGSRQKTIRDRERAVTQAADACSGDSLSTSLDQYEQALKGLAAAVAGTPRETDLKKSAGEASVWAGVAKWNDLRSGWRPMSPVPATAALLRYHDLRSYLQDYASSPERAAVESYQKFVAAVAKRHYAQIERSGSSAGPQQGLTQQLQNVFRNDQVASWLMFESTDGRRFYVTEPRTVEKSAQFTLATASGRTVKLQGSDLRTLTTQPAPQQKLSEKVVKDLSTVPDDRWEEAMLNVLSAIRDASEVDALLRYRLLRSAMSYASQGSLALESELKKLEDEWKRKRMEANIETPDLNARWMDPDDSNGNKMRDVAARALRQLPDLSKLAQAVRDANDALKKQWEPRHEVLGWLTQDAAGDWICRSNHVSRLKSSGKITLFLAGTDASGRATWRTIGDVQDGRITIQKQSADRLMVEGRLVFYEVNGTK